MNVSSDEASLRPRVAPSMPALTSCPSGTQNERMPNPKRWHIRPATRAGVRVVAVAVITLLLLEGVLRLLGVSDPVLYLPDPDCGYRLKPSQHLRYLGNSITINAWGVRDPRPFDARTEGVRRILVLGDSVTWGGIRLRQEDLFTTRLERLLENTEVINAGINGYSICRMTALYRTHLKGLAPDIVVVYAIPVDFIRPPVVTISPGDLSFPFTPPQLALWETMRLTSFHLARRTGWSWLAPRQRDLPTEPHLTENERFERNLSALNELRMNLPPSTRMLVALSPPSLAEAKPLRERVLSSLQDQGITLIDLASGKFDAPPNLFSDGVHLSPEGHAYVARVLAQNSAFQ